MIAGIYNRLKQGLGDKASVVMWGSESLPKAPYVIIKLEGQQLRVWIHEIPEQFGNLEDLWRETIPELLEDYQYVTEQGSTVTIENPRGEYTVQDYSCLVQNADRTISKERRFDIPQLQF